MSIIDHVNDVKLINDSNLDNELQEVVGIFQEFGRSITKSKAVPFKRSMSRPSNKSEDFNLVKKSKVQITDDYYEKVSIIYK